MMSLNGIFRGKETINNSKGCGGVMRIAPIPLYAALTTVWTSWRRTSGLVMPQKSPISIRLGIYLHP